MIVLMRNYLCFLKAKLMLICQIIFGNQRIKNYVTRNQHSVLPLNRYIKASCGQKHQNRDRKGNSCNLIGSQMATAGQLIIGQSTVDRSQFTL